MAKPQTAKAPQSKSKPLKRFAVRLRRTATLEQTREVEARNRREAERTALEQAKAEPFDLKKAAARDQIVRRG
jgi:hypothetical protein